MALLAILIGVGALVFYCFPIFLFQQINATSIRHWAGGGYAFVAPAPEFLGGSAIGMLFRSGPDSDSFPTASKIQMFEDGHQFGVPHSIHADIAKKGSGRFSYWGNEIVFSATDNSNPIDNGRSYAIRYPVSPPWWLPVVLLIIGGAGLSLSSKVPERSSDNAGKAEGALYAMAEVIRRLSHMFKRRYLFWGIAAALWLYLNVTFVLLLSAPIPYPDTTTYLNWSLTRTVGYPAILDFYHLLAGQWRYLPVFQLNLLLVGLFALCYSTIRVSGSYIIAWLLLALIGSAGNMLLSAADMLTESCFSAFVMMHLAFIYLFLNGGKRFTGLLAGLALAVAILIKSVAVVFLGPLFLFLLFLANRRKLVFLLIFCPAVAAWLAPSAYNYVQNGVFSSSALGGYALAGQVAWGIRPYPGGAFPQEARIIEHQLKPILAKRPAHFKNIEAYIDYTANEYNTLLWGNAVPALHNYYVRLGACVQKDLLAAFRQCSWMSCKSPCVLRMDSTLLQLSKEAIVRSPKQYVYQVSAHYYGMWRDIFAADADFLNGTNRRAAELPAAYKAVSNLYRKLSNSIPVFKDSSERSAIASHIENSAGKRLLDLVLLRKFLDKYVTSIMYQYAFLVLGISLIACLLIFRIRRASSAAKAFCYTGLCVNAYCLGTALAQPALFRYAWTMQGAVAAMLLIGVFLLIETLAHLAAVGKVKLNAGLSTTSEGGKQNDF